VIGDGVSERGQGKRMVGVGKVQSQTRYHLTCPPWKHVKWCMDPLFRGKNNVRRKMRATGWGLNGRLLSSRIWGGDNIPHRVRFSLVIRPENLPECTLSECLKGKGSLTTPFETQDCVQVVADRVQRRVRDVRPSSSLVTTMPLDSSFISCRGLSML